MGGCVAMDEILAAEQRERTTSSIATQGVLLLRLARAPRRAAPLRFQHPCLLVAALHEQLTFRQHPSIPAFVVPQRAQAIDCPPPHERQRTGPRYCRPESLHRLDLIGEERCARDVESMWPNEGLNERLHG